jgi:carboxylesterase type B
VRVNRNAHPLDRSHCFARNVLASHSLERSLLHEHPSEPHHHSHVGKRIATPRKRLAGPVRHICFARSMVWQRLLVLGCVAAAAPVFVDLDCGRVMGQLNESTGVASFLGIPFAMPPVGDKRFAPPVALQQGGGCWSGIFNASAFGPICPQSGQFQAGGNEDCLFINVWVPPSAASAMGSPGSLGSTEPSPVLVYLTGGDLTDGGTNTYNMAWLAQRSGRVVVSMGYRVNLFGFLALRELSVLSNTNTSGNYGFMDQIEALRWLQLNGRAFHANVDSVTLFGQSSGGTSIFALLGAPSARGLFHRAISLSGSTNLTMDLATAERQNLPLVAQLGCTSNLSDEVEAARQVVACLRNKTMQQLQAAVPEAWDTSKFLWEFPPASAASKGMQYNGVAIVDGVLVTHSLQDALIQNVNPVPLVITSMAQETDAQPGQVVIDMPTDQFQQLVLQTFAPWGEAQAKDIWEAYQPELAQGGPQMVYDSIMADYGQTCASAITAAIGAAHSPHPVYYVVFTSEPSHPIWGFDPTYQPRFSFHSWDIVAGLGHFDLWSSTRGRPAFQPQQSDLLFQSTVVELFTNFSRDGALNPTAGWSAALSQCESYPPPSWDPANITLPQCYTVVNVGTAGRVESSSNFRSSVCDMWLAAGFDQRFWWSN